MGWSQLQELVLNLPVTDYAITWTIELISSASSLQKLTLCPHTVIGYTRFLRTFSSTDILPRIQELNIQHTYVSEANLSRVTLRFQDSLRSFTFRNVKLISEGSWTSALREWESKLLLLQHFLLDSIWFSRNKYIIFPSLEDRPVVPGSGVQRLDLIQRQLDYRQHVCGVGYRGLRVDAALEIVVESIVARSTVGIDAICRTAG